MSEGNLQLMAGPIGATMPSHVLYADDVVVFCRASKKSILNLIKFFKDYKEVSGQAISLEKSKFYVGSSTTHSRIKSIADMLGFKSGCLPFTYLGVPIFKGKPRKVHLLPIADKIKNKLSSWKGSMLSIMGRVRLVSSIIQSMLLYNFRVYKWQLVS